VDASFNLEEEVERIMPDLITCIDPPLNPTELIKAREIIEETMRVEGPYAEWPVEFKVDLRHSSLGLRVRDKSAWENKSNECYWRQFM